MLHNKQLGFTLIEVIMVIIMLGIVSITALPKFFQKNTFAERAFFADTLNALRYAQKLAVATGCKVKVSFSSDSYSLTRKGDTSSTLCPPSGSIYSLAVPHPSSGANSYSGSESGITLTASVSSIIFNPLGTASTDATLIVGGVRTIKVIAKTGFVYGS